MVDINILYIILSVILAVMTGLFAFKWIKAKILLKEVAEALTATSIALQDDRLTDKEKDEIFREWRDVIIAAKDLI